MIVYNTCTTKAKTGEVPNYEIMVWIASVILYKHLGYTTKLYCATEDIPFLKREHIYELYDEINTECLDNDTLSEKINLKRFWSTRKLICMKYELDRNPTSIYSDTDILMYKPFDTSNCDALFWTTEPENSLLYINWNKVSTPIGYRWNKEYKKAKDAYNCGVMWFKDNNVFNTYYKEYLAFVLGNPCRLEGLEDKDNNIFACNSEQRLLKGILDTLNIKVDNVSNYDDLGIGKTGIHIFMHKRVWKNMFIFKEDSNERKFLVSQLNEIANYCFQIIKAYDLNIFNFLCSKDYFKVNELKYYA